MPSKTSNIRKRALECIKKRNWDAAIGEYRQLADLDQSNPNIYNELGDLYLKTNSKADAIKSYERAINAYTRVGLLNNAVAVCKKLLRFQTGNIEIFAQLGGLRKKQGFLKEANTYYLAYIEKLVLDVNIEPDVMKEKIIAVSEEMPESAEVLESVAGYLLKWESHENGAKVLQKLLLIYQRDGNDERADDVKTRLKSLGIDGGSFRAAPDKIDSENGWTEDKLWTKSPMSEGERIEVDKDSAPEKPRKPSSESHRQPPATTGSPQEYGTIELKKSDDAQADPASGQASGGQPERAEPIVPPPPVQEDTKPQDMAAGERDPSEEKVWIPDDDVPDQLSEGTDDNGGKVVHVSQIIDEFKSEIKESVDDEDYRSHYDLGMAYLEMDFLTEAIQEFQFAAKSNAYNVRSLEMIGMCFLNKGQPKLAIKQLLKGLELVGKSDREALGLLYNLGLAYEKIGEMEKAKGCFEDVYVVDVAFRDVAKKIQQHSS